LSELHYKEKKEGVHAMPVAVGTTLGIVAGALSGVGVFALPGLGFIYGAGALVGTIAGFDFGLISGGIVSIVETLVDKKHHNKLADHLENHHHIVLFKGQNVDAAEAIIKESKPMETL
jgi:membrane protein DedA with SNARE-associated domain